jgi:predicted nucleic acid-binding protein
VTLVIDAAPLVALADEREPRRNEILEILRAERGSLFIPAPVTAEIDYLLDRRFGAPARRAFLEDLAARRYESPGLEPADLNLGLADLSVAALAGRLGTRRILTFDQRHFRALRPIRGGAFTLLPADQ